MIFFGVFHFGNASVMAGRVPIAGGPFWIYVTGAALIAGGVAIVINKKAKLATQLLGLLLLIFAFSIHLPALLAGDQMSMDSFFKDVALAGGAWFMSEHFID